MRIERLAAHLKGAAEVRRWTIAHLPHGESALAYDLFLAIGTVLTSGEELEATELVRAVSQPEDAVRAQLRQWVDDGLLVLQAADAAAGERYQPTRRLISLFDAYVEASEHVFSARDEQRRRALHNAAPTPQHQALVGTLFDRFHDLGWLYLHNYAAVCFLMATLVRNVAQLHGHEARIASGYVDIRRPDGQHWLLGGPLPIAPGQVMGHAFTVIDEQVLVDFGLGNARRYYQRQFPWALACAHARDGQVHAALSLPTGEHIEWKDDYRWPDSDDELTNAEGPGRELTRQYARRFGLPQPG